MTGRPRLIVAVGVFIAHTMIAPRAPAGEPVPRSVIVVDVAPDARELNATKLREAIGAELEAEAVLPSDPRRRQATGEIAVSIDRETHELVVAYKGGGRSIVRRMDLPPDRAVLESAAVHLAGNLARDEADELMAELRQKKPTTAQAAAVEPPPAPPPAVVATPHATDEDSVEPWDDDRLRSTLMRYAESDHNQRLAYGWIILGLGAAAIGGGAYWGSQLNANSSPNSLLGPLGLIGGGVALSGAALVGLLTPTIFENLLRYYEADLLTGRTKPMVHADVEGLWTSYANSEHAQRRLAGWASIGAGVVFVGLGIVIETAWASTPPRVNPGAVSMFTWGAAFGIAGAVTLASPTGPIESRLRSYLGAGFYTPSFCGTF